ncbi:MAG: C69 family dipeptidase [Lactobacillus sp.]|nr:C69 family dipeptidase [Lactobacillus sp.]MDN6053028.1 C69 family dipeptidase [Lactobacillus sp.]
MLKQVGRSSCTSILIGKAASLTGSVIIGRNEDSKTAWPKHLAFYPAKTLTAPASFHSKDNQFTIELPKTSFAYDATPEWTDQYGVFAEDGINAYHVAMSATESAYANERVLAADPFNPESGLLEEAMVTIVLPYVKSAREGVVRLGDIVTRYGAAEANGILFADPNEAWYFEIGSGHHWVAERIPDDEYAVVANQLAIQVIDFTSPNFITSPGLAQFVTKNHLWPADQPFDWRAIFGTQDESDLHYNTPRVWQGQRRFNPSVHQDPQGTDLPFSRKPEQPISIQAAQAFLGDHYADTPYDLTRATNRDQATFRPVGVATTQESHLLELNGTAMTHWLAMGVVSQSVFIPFYPQGSIVPATWDQGAATYSPDSAYWVFKLVSVLVDRSWQRYSGKLNTVQTKAKIAVTRLRHEYDQKLQGKLSSAQRLDLVNEANQAMAKTVTDLYQQLAAELITLQTADSPLQFKMDPNL